MKKDIFFHLSSRSLLVGPSHASRVREADSSEGAVAGGSSLALFWGTVSLCRPFVHEPLSGSGKLPHFQFAESLNSCHVFSGCTKMAIWFFSLILLVWVSSYVWLAPVPRGRCWSLVPWAPGASQVPCDRARLSSAVTRHLQAQPRRRQPRAERHGPFPPERSPAC